MSSHPRHKTREELDPIRDASFIARIEHSKTCQNWSIIENTCYCAQAPTSPHQRYCLNCQCYEDEEIVLTGNLCQSCQDPKTCQNGDDGDRCAGCSRELHERHQDLLIKE